MGGLAHLWSVADFELSLLVPHSKDEALLKPIHIFATNDASVIILLEFFPKWGKINLVVSMVLMGHNFVNLAFLEDKDTDPAPKFPKTEGLFRIMLAWTNCWWADQVKAGKQVDHFGAFEVLQLICLFDDHLVSDVPRRRL